jgi:hypothetical protein
MTTLTITPLAVGTYPDRQAQAQSNATGGAHRVDSVLVAKVLIILNRQLTLPQEAAEPWRSNGGNRLAGRAPVAASR